MLKNEKESTQVKWKPDREQNENQAMMKLCLSVFFWLYVHGLFMKCISGFAAARCLLYGKFGGQEERVKVSKYQGRICKKCWTVKCKHWWSKQKLATQVALQKWFPNLAESPMQEKKKRKEAINKSGQIELFNSKK